MLNLRAITPHQIGSLKNSEQENSFEAAEWGESFNKTGEIDHV